MAASASSIPVRAVLSVKLAKPRRLNSDHDTVIKDVLLDSMNVEGLTLESLLDVLSADEVYVQELGSLEAIKGDNFRSARTAIATGRVLVAVQRDLRDDSGLEELKTSVEGLTRSMRQQSEVVEALGRKVGELEQRVEQRLAQGRSGLDSTVENASDPMSY